MQSLKFKLYCLGLSQTFRFRQQCEGIKQLEIYGGNYANNLYDFLQMYFGGDHFTRLEHKPVGRCITISPFSIIETG